MNRHLAGLALLVALAACGGGGSDGPVTPASLASDLGCSGFTATTTEELGVREVGTCSLDGSSVRVLTFATNDARDTFVTVAQQFGGIYVVVDQGAYGVESQSAAEKVKDKVGGSIK